MIEKDITETFVQWNHDTILGGVAGLIGYLFDLQSASNKKEVMPFRVLGVVTSVAMGAFVSYIVGTALIEGTEYRTLIVAVSGFSAYSLLTLARSRVGEVIFERLFPAKKE